MADIELNDLHKRYGTVHAVRGVDVSIESGEFIVILGPSGCGKSTLLRMIAGLEDISQGVVSIDGAAVNRLEPGQRGCAMVFQNYALYPHMSVAANMGYGLKVAGVRKAERRARVAEIAAMLGLEALLDRKPAELSGGQRQRVAMGRAMIRAPRVFLFDEPLSNLDAKLRVQMRLEIKRLHKKLKTTSVFVTHDQLEAMTMADRLVVMNDGLVEQVGTPQEIYRTPATRFVAGFIGTPAMNVLPAVIDEDGAAVVAGLGWRPCPDTAWDLPPGTEIDLAIRPAAISPAEACNGSPTFEAELTEDVGNEIHVHARGSDFDLTVSLPPDTPPVPARFSVAFAPGAIHAFAKTGGTRIEPRMPAFAQLPQTQTDEGRLSWPARLVSST